MKCGPTVSEDFCLVHLKVGQTKLVCDQSSLVGLCMQDYKPLCVAAVICAALVNIQTHTHTDRQTDNTVTSLYEKLRHMSHKQTTYNKTQKKTELVQFKSMCYFHESLHLQLEIFLFF